jgi:hypothetical protein
LHHKSHKEITEYVIDRFSHLLSDNIIRYKKYISKGSIKEDGLELHRPKHWHFYTPKDSTYLKPFEWLGITIYPSSNHRYNHLCTALQDISDKEIFFTTVGRVIHHIQDMSTPAHVIPIYHGLSFMPFVFATKIDMLEEYAKDNLSKEMSNNIFVSSSNDIESIESLIKYYHISATKTKEYIKDKKIKIKDTTVSLDIFWKEYHSSMSNNRLKDGFGEYGKYHKHFGKDFLLFIDNKEYLLRFEDYKSVYIELINKMILETLYTLIYIDKQYLLTKDFDNLD